MGPFFSTMHWQERRLLRWRPGASSTRSSSDSVDSERLSMPDSTWNNWQGYLLKAFMGTELVEDPAGNYWAGDWSYANLGVIVALVLAFVITWVARRSVVRRQEEGA